jgi:hypothetical protein
MQRNFVGSHLLIRNLKSLHLEDSKIREAWSVAALQLGVVDTESM